MTSPDFTRIFHCPYGNDSRSLTTCSCGNHKSIGVPFCATCYYAMKRKKQANAKKQSAAR